MLLFLSSDLKFGDDLRRKEFSVPPLEGIECFSRTSACLENAGVPFGYPWSTSLELMTRPPFPTNSEKYLFLSAYWRGHLTENRRRGS